MTNSVNSKYHWMKPRQRELFNELCSEFKFKSLSEVGKYLGLKNPYHGSKVIFESNRTNNYLIKLLELKKESNERVKSLERIVSKMDQFKSSVDKSVKNLDDALKLVKTIKIELDNKKY